MGLPVISVEHLSKSYLVGHEGPRERYQSFRDLLLTSGRNLARQTADLLRGRQIVEGDRVEEFWALKDVSFEVQSGDVIGIIGRNGAGKSTLLKILSRITEPSEGRVTLRGRVASLLEVGTGFHSELTGRENIFLNGTILGMNRAEIRAKFDEIVAFSQVDQFLDTPMKRYSSGMYVRLAFAVAAHLEPEVLVVDEVLAVGDADFQKKCLGKMSDVAKGGRTVLFVSHNLAAVTSLCGKVVYLHAGRVRGVGPSERLAGQYLIDLQAGGAKRSTDARRVGDALDVEACEVSPNPTPSGGTVALRVAFSARRETHLRELALLVHQGGTGVRTAVIDFRGHGVPATIAAGEPWEIRGEIRSLPFVEGNYGIGVYVATEAVSQDVPDLSSLSVSPRAVPGQLPSYPAVHRGIVELDFRLTSCTTTTHAS